MKREQAFPPETAEEIEAIRRDNIHGAGYLAQRSVEVLAKAVSFYGGPEDISSLRGYLVAVAAALAQAQPSMCSIANVLAQVLEEIFAAPGEGPQGFGEVIVRIAASPREQRELHGRRLEALAVHGKTLLEAIPGGLRRIVTLSYSEAVLSVLLALEAPEVEVTVAESRPLGEGVGLARSLAERGVRVCVVTDAMLGAEIAGVSAALAGADTITSLGGVVNKAGTRLLALAARAEQVPFYCCSETLKVQPSLWPEHSSQALRPPEEVLASPPPGVAVRNCYFDRTESGLVSAYVTEKGVLTAGDIQSVSRALARRRRNVFGSALRPG